MKKAAIYLRVSTERQKTENQLPECKALAERRGWEVTKIYEEHESAVKHRPILERCIADGRAGRYDVVVFWALDRLSRSGVRGTLELLERFTRHGLGLVSVREDVLDTTAPHGELVVSVWAFLAKQERVRLRERIFAGLARARAEGKTLGRKPVSPVKLRAAAEENGKGKSQRAAARAHGVSPATLNRYIQMRRRSKTLPGS